MAITREIYTDFRVTSWDKRDSTPENKQARDDARVAAIAARTAYQTETGGDVPRPI